MPHIKEIDDSHGVVFRVEGTHDTLADEVDDPAFRTRLRSVLESDIQSTEDALQALLQVAADQLAVEHAHLAHIDVGDGSHTIASVSGPHPGVSEGETRDLSATYCRMVLAEHGVLALHNAPAEGWSDDAAYEEFGFSTYLGTTVVADEEFYGTLCLVDRDVREEPFTEEDAAIVELLARAAGQLLSERPPGRSAKPTAHHLETLFEHAPTMINFHDREGNVIAPNPHLCEKTGYTRDELTTMKVWDLDREIDPESARARWAKMVPGDRARWEGVYQCKDGSTFPIEGDVRCIELEGQIRFVVSSRDITERRAAERALEESEEIHRETLRNITDTVVVTQDDGTLTYVCPNVNHIFGYDDQEVMELGTISALLDGDPADEHSFEEGAELTNVEWSITDAEGSDHDLLINVRGVAIRDGTRMYTCRDITGRKQAERELRETKQRLEQTVESLAEAVLVIDPPERRIVTCNAAVEKIFGYEKEELIGASTRKLHKSEEAFERFGASSEPALEEEGMFQGEYQMRRKDGEIIETEHVVTPLEGGDWTDGVVSIVRDVTERKKRDQMIRRHKNLLAQAERLAGAWEVDLRSGDMSWTEKVYEIHELPPGTEVTVEQALSFYPSDARSQLREAYERCMEEGESYDLELPLITAKENRRWVRTVGAPVEGEDGEIIKVVGAFQDVTDRKEAEKRLREEHDLLNRILETSPVAIAVFNTEGEFVSASGRAEDVLGLEREEVEGRTYNDPAWQIRRPDGAPMPDEDLPFARVMATGEPVYDVEHRIVWPDGTDRLLSVSGAPLRDSEGELEGAVFHIDDITEQRAAHQRLTEERDRFATLFHNLPTPVVHGRRDEEGQVRIQAVNERFEAVFGYEEADIQGKDLQELIVPNDEADAAAFTRERLLAGESVNQDVRRRAADGLRDFRIQVALREGEAGPTEGFAIYTDVTERKEREQALAERRALLEAQAESTLDGLLAVDSNRDVAFFNDRFLKIWNLPRSVFDRAHSERPAEEEFLDAASGLLSDPQAFRDEVEYLYDHPDRESRDTIRLTDGRWLDRYSGPIVGETGEHFGRLWVFRDVTDQREMMDRLLEVQEEERRRIDQEIHDEMGGLLTSIQFSVGLARSAVQEDDPSAEQLDEIETFVHDLATVSRTISRKLYPSDLSEHGWFDALQSLADDMKRKRDLDVDLYNEIESGDRYPVLIERTAYWVIQEILMSVARAGVGGAQVVVSKRGKRLYLHVFHEGPGFGSSPQDKGERFRLEAIQRRTEWLDGDVRIESIPDEGTRLSITLPTRLPFPNT